MDIIKPALCVFLALAISIAESASAASWTVDSSLLVGGGYSDNSRDNASPRSTGARGNIKPAVRVSAATGRASFAGFAEYGLNRFAESDSGNEDSRTLNLNSAYRSARQVWNLTGDIRTRNQLQNEIVESGVVTDDTTQTSKSLLPTWNWRISQRDNLSVDLSYRDVSYSNVEGTSLRDFNSQFASTRLTHRFSGKFQAYGSVAKTFFEFEDKTNESDTLSGDIGFNYDLTPLWSFGASVGNRTTSSTDRAEIPVGFTVNGQIIITGTTTIETEQESSGATYAGHISREFATGSVSMNANRSVSVSASQGEILSDRAELLANRRFGPRWTVSTSGRFSRNEAVDQLRSNLDRTNTRAQLGITWKPKYNLTIRTDIQYSKQKPTGDSRVVVDVRRGTTQRATRISSGIVASWEYTRHWTFSASYRYTDRDAETDSSDEKIHAFQLTLLRTWPTMTFSR